MTETKVDHSLRNFMIFFGILFPILFVGQSYFHYQTSSAIDCSLLTPENNVQNPGSNYVNLMGKNITVTQENQKCFNASAIKVYELCYYVSCGEDTNQTVNYQFKSIKHSLDDPDKSHMYPNHPVTSYWETFP